MKNIPSFDCKLRLSFFAFLIIALFATAVLAATDYGDISVKVEIVPGNFGGEGYVEYRATITNRSTARSHTVTLTIPSEGYVAFEASIRELTRTIEVAPGATVTVSLFQPPLPMEGVGLAVRIDGRRQNDPVPLNPASSSASPGSYSSSGPTVHLLLSQSVNKSGALNQAGVLGNQGERVENTQTGGAFTRARTVTASSDLPIQEWSAHWLGYSRYSGVVVTGDDLRVAPAPVQEALWRYVECGGVLLVFGQWTAPQQWQARQSWVAAQPASSDEETDAEKPVEREENSEKAVMTTAPDYKPGKDDLRAYFIGYGALIVSGDVDASRINGEQWERIVDFWGDSRVDGLAGHWNINAINRQFPVVEELGTPVRGLFLLMLLFVVVIGPVNYLLLARRRKKVWLWWTVPAISVAASLGVFGYAMLAEGWRGYARAEVMTILDENGRRATTIGLTAFYAPLTPSDGLRFSYDTEVLPQLPEMNRYYRSSRGGSPRAIDWTEDQHLTSGWITARVPAHFAIRKSEPRRERLNVRREAGAISIVNGLGADIRQLWWAEGDGKVYSAENVQAGAHASLKLTELWTRGEVAGLREAFRSNWEDQIKHYSQTPLETLEAGCYLAVLDSSPFLEEGLRGSVSRKALTIVYGVQASGQEKQ
jgi:hypothetical protein